MLVFSPRVAEVDKADDADPHRFYDRDLELVVHYELFVTADDVRIGRTCRILSVRRDVVVGVAAVVVRSDRIERISADAVHSAQFEPFGVRQRLVLKVDIVAEFDICPENDAQEKFLIPPEIKVEVEDILVTSHPARKVFDSADDVDAFCRVHSVVTHIECETRRETGGENIAVEIVHLVFRCAVDIDFFQFVAEVCPQILRDRDTERDAEAETVLAVVGVVFVNVGIVVQVSVVERNIERDIGIDEPRFVETEAHFAAHSAELTCKTQALAVTQEVVLFDFCVEKETFKRRETCADIEGSAFTLLDGDDHLRHVRGGAFDYFDLDFIVEACSFQVVFALFLLRVVVEVAFGDLHFTPQNFVARPVVAGERNFLDEAFFPFSDDEIHVNRLFFVVKMSAGKNFDKRITFVSVDAFQTLKIPDGF